MTNKSLLLLSILFLMLFYSCNNDPVGSKNSDPIIHNLFANPDSILTQGYAEIICIASDKDNDDLQYLWRANSGSFSGSEDTVKWFPPDEIGKFYVDCKVIDSNGAFDTDSILVQVGSSIPKIDSIISDKKRTFIGESIKLTCFATDPDNDELIYLWESDDGSFKGSGSEIEWIAPETVGFYSLSCKVLDNNGNYDISNELVIEVLNLNEGLVAYFPFNNNANDESKNGNNGTNFGATLTNDQSGNENSAYEFNGYAYLSVNHNSMLNPNGNDFSISIWFQYYGDLNSDTTYDALVVKGDYNSGSEQLLEWMVRGGSYNGAFFRFRTFTQLEDLQFDTDQSSIVSDGAWHNLVVVIDEGSIMEGKMYLDGVLKGTREKFTLNINPYEKLLIGNYSWGSKSYFHGKLDQVRVFKRALTEMDIMYLYQNKI